MALRELEGVFFRQGQEAAKQVGTNINDKLTGAKDYVQDKWDKGVEAAKQASANVNATYQTNRLNSKIQTAIQTADDALTNLITLDGEYAKYRNGSTLGNRNQRKTIVNAQAVLRNIKSRYNQTADAYANNKAKKQM